MWKWKRPARRSGCHWVTHCHLLFLPRPLAVTNYFNFYAFYLGQYWNCFFFFSRYTVLLLRIIFDCFDNENQLYQSLEYISRSWNGGDVNYTLIYEPWMMLLVPVIYLITIVHLDTRFLSQPFVSQLLINVIDNMTLKIDFMKTSLMLKICNMDKLIINKQ